MNINIVISLAFVCCILLMLSTSCEKEDCKTCDRSPILDYQEFSIAENSPNGTVIDTVEVSNTESVHSLVFEIIGGNPENIFSIDPGNGVIIVAESSLLDFEKNTFHELAVKVTVGTELKLTSSNTIKITVIDIQPSQDGLVAYYPFDGNSFDIIGENTGVENNVEYLSMSYAHSDQVIAFNGINSYVTLQNGFDFETITVSLWFNALKIKELVGPIYSSDYAGLNNGLTIISVRKDENINHLYLNFSGHLVTVEIEENTWYNATIIRDNKAYKYYLNGLLIKSGEFTEYYDSGDGISSAVIGCLRTLNRRFFEGLVDNLRIYDRALSETEVKTLINE